jgi:hypothetical protein
LPCLVHTLLSQAHSKENQRKPKALSDPLPRLGIFCVNASVMLEYTCS